MKEWRNREWDDPTTIEATDLADRGGRRRLLPVNSSSVHIQILPSTQVQIEARIHTLRIQLAAGIIDRASYSGEVKPLRASLRQVKKGGQIK